MESIDKAINILLEEIKKDAAYREYKQHEAILMSDPELLSRVDRFRAENFHMQNQESPEDQFQSMDRLIQESDELRKIPEANAFLEAELALCKLVQKISKDIVMGIQMHTPDF